MEYIERNPLPEVCAHCADRIACLMRGEGEWCCEECENLLARFTPSPARQNDRWTLTKPVKPYTPERECHQKP